MKNTVQAVFYCLVIIVFFTWIFTASYFLGMGTSLEKTKENALNRISERKVNLQEKAIIILYMMVGFLLCAYLLHIWQIIIQLYIRIIMICFITGL